METRPLAYRLGQDASLVVDLGAESAGWRLGDERVTARRLLQHAPAERVAEAEALTRRALRDLRAAAAAEDDRRRAARLRRMASGLWAEHRDALNGRGRGGQGSTPRLVAPSSSPRVAQQERHPRAERPPGLRQAHERLVVLLADAVGAGDDLADAGLGHRQDVGAAAGAGQHAARRRRGRCRGWLAAVWRPRPPGPSRTASTSRVPSIAASATACSRRRRSSAWPPAMRATSSSRSGRGKVRSSRPSIRTVSPRSSTRVLRMAAAVTRCWRAERTAQAAAS